MLINQACTEFVKGYFSTHERSEKTKSAYLSDINQFQEFIGGDTNLLHLNSVHIERWADSLRKREYSPASIRRKIIVLKVFCSYWLRHGVLLESPFWRVKISYGRIEQLPRTLSEIEIQNILKQAKKELTIREKTELNNQTAELTAFARDYRNLRNLALLEVLFATGMRVGELSSINTDDFQLEESLFKIKGKGGRERLAFLVDEFTIKLLQEYFATRLKIETKSCALFLNAVGGRLTTQGIAKIIAQLSEDSGVTRNVTPHMLRHTVATLLLRNGTDIRVVQEFLGHASIATTQRYVHIVKDHMIRELKHRHPSLSFRKNI